MLFNDFNTHKQGLFHFIKLIPLMKVPVRVWQNKKKQKKNFSNFVEVLSVEIIKLKFVNTF